MKEVSCQFLQKKPEGVKLMFKSLFKTGQEFTGYVI